LQCLFDASGRDWKDPIRSNYLPWLYYFVEVPTAIICCSAPSLPAVYKKIRASKLGSGVFGHFGSADSHPRTPEHDSKGPSDPEIVQKRSNDSMNLQTYDFADERNAS
jgi:hypothetical protein